MGSIAIKEIWSDGILKDKLNIVLINDDLSPDNLNEHCGAEFVQKDQKLPCNWEVSEHANKKCISFDGDADR